LIEINRPNNEIKDEVIQQLKNRTSNVKNEALKAYKIGYFLRENPYGEYIFAAVNIEEALSKIINIYPDILNNYIWSLQENYERVFTIDNFLDYFEENDSIWIEEYKLII